MTSLLGNIKFCKIKINRIKCTSNKHKEESINREKVY